MTEGIAIEIAKQKMLELAVGENYILRYRHFNLLAGVEITIKADNDLMLLLCPDDNVSVNSKTGWYNVQDHSLNEMQYIHTGKITVKNQSENSALQVKFLQVIPKHK